MAPGTVISEDYIRDCILLAYNLKKTPKEAKDVICRAMGKDAISVERCEVWYERFENGDFGFNNSNTSIAAKEPETGNVV